MKKLLTLVLALMLGATCLFTATACGKSDDKPTVTIGYTDYAPMNYEEDGELVGFDTELAKKVFGDLGYNVRFKLIEWSNKYTELDSGIIDCVWNGFTANVADDDGVQRADKVDFSYNYMQNAQCIISKSGAEISSVAELDGKSVAFEAGSAGESYVDGLTGNINKKPVVSQMDAVREVNAGTAQYAVVDILLAQSLAGQGNYSTIVINDDIQIDVEYYAIAFKKGSDLTAKVNQKLVELAGNGYISTLAQKYGLSTQVIIDYSSQIA